MRRYARWQRDARGATAHAGRPHEPAAQRADGTTAEFPAPEPGGPAAERASVEAGARAGLWHRAGKRLLREGICWGATRCIGSADRGASCGTLHLWLGAVTLPKGSA